MIELKNISFSAENEDGTTKTILKDVSLTVDENRFIVVTGPNGSGKSTLAKLIMGIIKPTAGKTASGKHAKTASRISSASSGESDITEISIRFVE